MSTITILDGGMGQELLRRSSRDVTPMWSADIMLNEPELVRDLHREFIDSGARVITLNTYTATPERLKRENQFEQLAHLHHAATRAAQEAIALTQRDDVMIAGSLPPLVASYHPEVSLSFEDSLVSYRRFVKPKRRVRRPKKAGRPCGWRFQSVILSQINCAAANY